ncbi:MAG: dockerin type I domain-containing protein, partial [bacterium]
LSVGAHTITLRGTDSGGLFTERTIAVTVTARTFNNGDLNGDGSVNAADMTILLSSWGENGIADINADGLVGSEDLAALLSLWN